MNDSTLCLRGTSPQDPPVPEDERQLVMIVEDSELDARLLKRVLGRLRPEVNVVHSADGLAALGALEDAGSRRPDLIIMDIRMPRMSGREALVEIKNDARLRSIPVIMMSTSKDDVDVTYCYDHHANAYVTKSFSTRDTETMENLVRFWLETAGLG